MMIKYSQKAVTLMELLIALSLVSVVVFGIASFNMVLNKYNQDYRLKYLVKSQASAELAHILNNAAIAVGAGTGTNKGIKIGLAETGNTNTLCFRQDLNTDGSLHSPATSDDYTDDRWLCYTATSNKIYYCTKTYALGAGACTTSDTLLGAAVSDTFTSPAPTFSSNIFTVSIHYRYNPALAVNTSTNPEITVSGSISPAGHSI